MDMFKLGHDTLAVHGRGLGEWLFRPSQGLLQASLPLRGRGFSHMAAADMDEATEEDIESKGAGTDCPPRQAIHFWSPVLPCHASSWHASSWHASSRLHIYPAGPQGPPSPAREPRPAPSSETCREMGVDGPGPYAALFQGGLWRGGVGWLVGQQQILDTGGSHTISQDFQVIPALPVLGAHQAPSPARTGPRASTPLQPVLLSTTAPIRRRQQPYMSSPSATRSARTALRDRVPACFPRRQGLVTAGPWNTARVPAWD